MLLNAYTTRLSIVEQIEQSNKTLVIHKQEFIQSQS